MPNASLVAHAAVTSPGANATLTFIPSTSLVVGQVYKVTAYVWLEGTVSAVDDDNFNVLANGNSIGAIPISGVVTNNVVTFDEITPPMGGVFGIFIKTVGAGTVGSIYHATIVVTEIDQTGIVQ